LIVKCPEEPVDELDSLALDRRFVLSCWVFGI
jgi:hypothetical protein